MLKLDSVAKQFTQVPPVLMPEMELKEREHLQQSILNSARAFFDELDEDVRVLGSEVMPSNEVTDKIDILGIDEEGFLVIIELKRGKNKWQLSQALAYAAMVREWGTGEDFIKRLRQVAGPQAVERLNDLGDANRADLNRLQRVIIIAELYDLEVLLTAKWLTDEYGLSIGCYRISFAKEDGSGTVYASCTRVYPPMELNEHAAKRGHKGLGAPVSSVDFDTALARSAPFVADFFRKRLAMTPPSRMNSHQDALAYPPLGTIHWYLEPRRQEVRVVQVGRFQLNGQQDVQFWQTQLKNPQIRYRRNGQNLHFSLTTQEDLDFFQKSMDGPNEFKWKNPDAVSEQSQE